MADDSVLFRDISEDKVYIVSEPMPFVDRFPEDIRNRPKIIAKDKWPNTQVGDNVYDVTEWFKHGLDSSVKGEQWVYYNQDSHYFIARAGWELREYLYSYVVHEFHSAMSKLHVTYDYIEIEEDVSLSYNELKKAEYKLLSKGSFIADYGHSFSEGDKNLTVYCNFLAGGGEGAIGLSVNISEAKEDVFNFNVSILPGQRLIREVGLSKASKRKIMMLSVDTLTAEGATVVWPKARENVIYIQNAERMSIDKSLYTKSYSVPVDFLELMQEADENVLEDESDDFLAHKRNALLDVTSLMAENGVLLKNSGAIAYYLRSKSKVYAHMNAFEHNTFFQLTTDIGLGEPVSYIINGALIAIDPIDDKVAYNYADILSSNPKVLRNFGAILHSRYDDSMLEIDGEESIRAILDYTYASGSGIGIASVSLKFKIEEVTFASKFSMELSEEDVVISFLERSEGLGKDLVVVSEIKRF